MRRRALVIACLLIGGCGDEEPPATTPAPSSSTVSEPVISDPAEHADAVTALLEETETFIESTPQTPANAQGWRTVASAYSAAAEELRTMDPPKALAVEHGALVAEAQMIADEATRISSLDDPFTRTSDGLELHRRRNDLMSQAASLG